MLRKGCRADRLRLVHDRFIGALLPRCNWRSQERRISALMRPLYFGMGGVPLLSCDFGKVLWRKAPRNDRFEGSKKFARNFLDPPNARLERVINPKNPRPKISQKTKRAKFRKKLCSIHLKLKMERKTRLELATFSLARRHSTTELLPQWLDHILAQMARYVGRAKQVFRNICLHRCWCHYC